MQSIKKAITKEQHEFFVTNKSIVRKLKGRANSVYCGIVEGTENMLNITNEGITIFKGTKNDFDKCEHFQCIEKFNAIKKEYSDKEVKIFVFKMSNDYKKFEKEVVKKISVEYTKKDCKTLKKALMCANLKADLLPLSTICFFNNEVVFTNGQFSQRLPFNQNGNEYAIDVTIILFIITYFPNGFKGTFHLSGKNNVIFIENDEFVVFDTQNKRNLILAFKEAMIDKNTTLFIFDKNDVKIEDDKVIIGEYYVLKDTYDKFLSFDKNNKVEVKYKYNVEYRDYYFDENNKLKNGIAVNFNETTTVYLHLLKK